MESISCRATVTAYSLNCPPISSDPMLSTGVGGVAVGFADPEHAITRTHRILSVQRMRLDRDVDAGGTVRPAITSETGRAGRPVA
jgi:hypothetical protein